jgi:hypothetical protein
MAQVMKLADWQQQEEDEAFEKARRMQQMEEQVAVLVAHISKTRAFGDWLLGVGWKHNASDEDMVMAFLADMPG